MAKPNSLSEFLQTYDIDPDATIVTSATFTVANPGGSQVFDISFEKFHSIRKKPKTVELVIVRVPRSWL